jgi:hypothetical protein
MHIKSIFCLANDFSEACYFYIKKKKKNPLSKKNAVFSRTLTFIQKMKINKKQRKIKERIAREKYNFNSKKDDEIHGMQDTVDVEDIVDVAALEVVQEPEHDVVDL